MRTKIDRVSYFANELRKKANQTSMPVDVEACARQEGVQLTFEAFDDDLSGLLIKKGDRKIIGVNSNHGIPRQRFTIAHELGHLLLQHHGEVFVDQTVIKRDPTSSLAIDTQEIEANRFAAELLMPEELVQRRARELQQEKGESGLPTLVQDLASEFRVSSQAMQFRLINLGVMIPGD